MTTIDEIVGKKVKQAGGDGGDDSSIDSYLKEEDKMLVSEARRSKLEEIIAQRKKSIAVAEKERMMVTGAEGPLGMSVAVSPNAQHALLKTLIDSGTDAGKAAAFLNALDQETLARLMVLSGGASGANSLLPLMLLSRQPQTQIGDLVSAAKSITEMVPKQQGNSFSEMVDAFATVADVMDKRRGGEDSTGETIRSELAAMRQTLEAEREARHQSDLSNQRVIADLREGALKDQLAEIQGQLQQLQGRDITVEVEKAKKTLEALGFKMGKGDNEELDTLKEITKTVIESPAVEGLSQAVGDRIRTQGFGRRSQQQGGSSATGAIVYCDVCKGRGVNTPLTVTPEIQAGKADLVCPICGTSYSKSSG